MSMTCTRLSDSAKTRIICVLQVLLFLMALRYWHVGDHGSGIALAALFLYRSLNAVLRFINRRQPPREFKERYIYVFLAGAAIDAAIFGFVGVRSWHNGSLLWSGLCWTIAITVAFVSTFGTVMYFRSRKRNEMTIAQMPQSSQSVESGD